MIPSTVQQKDMLQWSEENRATFERVRDAVSNCPKLFFVDYKSDIVLRTDASDLGVGAYLYQVKDGEEQPIAFLSKAFNTTQRHWSTHEKEAFAIFYALGKLDYLLRDVRFTIETDHENLTRLNVMGSAKATRWKVFIQEYDFKVKHIQGTTNVVADSFSRLCSLRTSSSLQTQPIMDNHRRAISAVHNSTVGHMGIDVTLQRLRSREGEWASQRREVQEFIQSCPVCQKASTKRPRNQGEHHVVSRLQPMECVSVDSVGPLPVSAEGYDYVIVLIDNFSRFVELVPTKGTTSQEAARALMSFVGRYGVPKTILSDRGPQYVNQTIEALTKALRIEHQLTMAYSHEENGIVERAMQPVMKHLRAIILSENVKDHWQTYLPLVQRIMNSNVHSATGHAPSAIVFGGLIDLDRDILTDRSNEEREGSMNDYVEDLRRRQREICELSRQVQERLQVENLARNATNPATEFKVGDKVLVEHRPNRGRPRPPDKLAMYWEGPFVITAKERISFYRVQNLANVNRCLTVHVSQIKPFVYDPQYVNPREVARTDNQLFEVEEVKRHRGDPKYKSRLQFLIKWAGYDDSENTWVPWSDVRNNAIVHRYLRARRLERLIPLPFRSEESDETDQVSDQEQRKRLRHTPREESL
jgi:transposase InsO family protein